MPDPTLSSPRTTRRRIALAGLSGLLLLGASAGWASEPSAPTQEVQQATDVAPASSPRMQHPAKGYLMTIAYFERHRADIDLDALGAIKIVAQKARDIGSAIVVTCHDADMFDGSGPPAPPDLANRRLAAIGDGLVAQGITLDRIRTNWGDPALAAAAQEHAGVMTSDHPTCLMETAVDAAPAP
jgi:hypothetical protein